LTPPNLKTVVSTLVVLICLTVSMPALAVPLTFQIPVQPQFGSFVSGFLTFDPVGIYFAGPFDIRIGANPARGIPADEFSNANTFYVIQPNTSFHSLWVFDHDLSLPVGRLFLLVDRDSCLNPTGGPLSCIFEMSVYISQCSDCVPVIASEQGAVRGVVPAPTSLGLLLTGLGGLVSWRYRKLKGHPVRPRLLATSQYSADVRVCAGEPAVRR